MTPRILFASVLLLSSSLMLAQTSRDSGATRPAFEISGGFAIAGGGSLGPGRGFTAGVDAHAYGPLYLAAETTYLDEPSQAAYGASDTAILLGPRYRRGRATAVFVDVLAGADVFNNHGQDYTHQFNDATGLALAADFGADIACGHRFAIRPQGGYFYTRLTDSTYSGPITPAHTALNRGRFGIGVAYRF